MLGREGSGVGVKAGWQHVGCSVVRRQAVRVGGQRGSGTPRVGQSVGQPVVVWSREGRERRLAWGWQPRRRRALGEGNGGEQGEDSSVWPAASGSE